ncbi:MAG: manganese efflux pump MntP family protein [Mobilitalea sp.]
MDIITLILLAIGLSADAFAVSVTNGICSRKITKRNALVTALTFGFFQALMPVLGFLLGKTFSGFVNRYQHWIALILLAFIGFNMVKEALKEFKDPESCDLNKDIFTAKNLVMQGIATSIDALAAGVSLAVLDVNIYSASLLIGAITFICCLFGVYIGKKFGFILGARAKLVGGLVLIIIGLKLFITGQFL